MAEHNWKNIAGFYLRTEFAYGNGVPVSVEPEPISKPYTTAI
ncbi:MAG: hypothetical protein Q7S36_02655 [Candidatus Liptonbacteria bacterium]|nr:hypothetical protein [Candidatus Liptonbacteria bacterium]